MSVLKSIELNKTFATKEARNDSLLANSKEIINLKKSIEHKSALKGQIVSFNSFKQSASKALFDMKLKHFYPTINTTKIMDSHGDVHEDDLWFDSLKTVSDNLSYTTDHELYIDNIVAFPGTVKAFTADVDWLSLGYNYPGKTQALIYEIEEDAIIHDKARAIIERKVPIQNSVRMGYEEILLAINDDRADFRENKALFDSYISKIVNKQVALENGYFWLVKKASIILEGSMVLRGSNEVTPLLLPEENQIIAVSEKEVVSPKNRIIKTAYKHFI